MVGSPSSGCTFCRVLLPTSATPQQRRLWERAGRRPRCQRQPRSRRGLGSVTATCCVRTVYELLTGGRSVQLSTSWERTTSTPARSSPSRKGGPHADRDSGINGGIRAAPGPSRRAIEADVGGGVAAFQASLQIRWLYESCRRKPKDHLPMFSRWSLRAAP